MAFGADENQTGLRAKRWTYVRMGWPPFRKPWNFLPWTPPRFIDP